MSATALVELPRPANRTKPGKKRPIALPLKPGFSLRSSLRSTAKRLLEDGYNYRDSLDLLRFFLLDEALTANHGVKKAAAARLGITRDHVRDYYARGAELVR